MRIYSVGEIEFDKYDFEEGQLDSDQYEWLVYGYEQGFWDGSGYAVALRKDGQLQYKGLDHCSCFGPLDGWPGASSVTIEEFFRVKENIHDDDWSLSVKRKVKELLGL